MTRRCSRCANEGHNSRTCPFRGGGSGGVKLFGVRLTDGKKSANMGNLSAHYHSSSSAAAASPNPSSPSLDRIHDPPYLPDGYLSDDPAHAPSSSNRRAHRKKDEPRPFGVVFVQPLEVALCPIVTTERITRSRLKAIQKAEASVAEACASPTKKRLRKGLLVSERGTSSAIPPSGPEGSSTAIGHSSDSDDDDNLSIVSRVTRPKTRRLVLLDAEEKSSAEAETMAEAEPIAEAEDVGKGHDIPPTKSGQVSLVAKVTEGDMIAEGVKAPNPVDSIHFDHSSIGGEDFVPKISRVGGEDVAVTSDVGSPNLVQLTEVAANLATRGATAAAGTSDPVASATSEELANLDFTHFPEVPPDLGVSQDFYTGMDTTILPDLNVEEYHIEDCFFKRHGDTVSVGLPRELSSPGHLPASTHFNVAGQSSSGEVRHPQSFGHSASLPFVTQASGDMRESSQPSAEVSFLSYWVSAEVTPILVRIQTLHPSTFTAFKVPGKACRQRCWSALPISFTTSTRRRS